jgi:hypothetical protein
MWTENVVVFRIVKMYLDIVAVVIGTIKSAVDST